MGAVRALLRAVQQGLWVQKGVWRDAMRLGVHQGMGGSWVVWKGHAGGVSAGSCSLLWEKSRMEEGWCCKCGEAGWA